MKKTSFALSFSALVLSVSAMQLDNAGSNGVMSVYTGGFLVQAGRTRICTRDFRNGTTGKRLKIYPNTQFKDNDFKGGAIIARGERFWMLGGEGIRNNKRWQATETVVTGTVGKDGIIEGLKAVRSLPFPVKGGRALIHDNKIWHLGGINRSELLSAEILANGELGEWKKHPSYPASIADGGFAVYKNVIYANGRSSWRPGSSKMFAIRLTKDGVGKRWERVESPDDAQGFMAVHNGGLYYFDEVSGNIYKTTQEKDGFQLKEWQTAGKMPCPPKSSGVSMTEVPGGYLFFGGFMPKKADGKFGGFFKGTFLPHSALK